MHSLIPIFFRFLYVLPPLLGYRIVARQPARKKKKQCGIAAKTSGWFRRILQHSPAFKLQYFATPELAVFPPPPLYSHTNNQHGFFLLAILISPAALVLFLTFLFLPFNPRPS